MMISSRQNAWFKRVRDAIRDHADEIVIEGPKFVGDAIAAGWKPIAVVRAASGEQRAGDIAFDAKLFDDLAETRTSQGVLALFERPPNADVFAPKDTIVVALDGVQDPGNVGTIVRLAAAFDASVALLPGCADPFSPKAIRASAGAILSVSVAQVTPADLLNCGLPLFAADGSASVSSPPARNAVLILGSEGSGVSRELLDASTRVAIKTSGGVESLNVATAAAILLSKSFELR